MVECRGFAATSHPFGLVAEREHEVVAPRVVLRRHGRPVAAAVRREIEATRRPAVPPLKNSAGGSPRSPRTQPAKTTGGSAHPAYPDPPWTTSTNRFKLLRSSLPFASAGPRLGGGGRRGTGNRVRGACARRGRWRTDRQIARRRRVRVLAPGVVER